MRSTDRVAEAGIEPSVGSRGDSYDDALAESIIGLFQREAIQRTGPWRHVEAIAFAALTWVDWFNTRRLLEPIGDVPPAKYEASDYQHLDEGGARRHPHADTVPNGTAAEHPQFSANAPGRRTGWPIRQDLTHINRPPMNPGGFTAQQRVFSLAPTTV